jgi:hypothetical protein
MAKCFLICITILAVILLLIYNIDEEEIGADGLKYIIVIVLLLLGFAWIITICLDRDIK